MRDVQSSASRLLSLHLRGSIPGWWTSSVIPDEEKVRRAVLADYASNLTSSRHFFCLRDLN